MENAKHLERNIFHEKEKDELAAYLITYKKGDSVWDLKQFRDFRSNSFLSL